MKIGFDAKRYFHNKTGLGNYSRDLVRILTQFYPENQYILYNPKPSKSYQLDEKLKNTIEINPTSFISKKLKGLWRSIWISKQIKEDKITIYHGLSGEIPFGLLNNVKKIVTIHDLIFLHYPKLYSYADRKIHTFKFKYASKKSNLIIAISEKTKSDIVNYFGVDPKKIKVIYQGCGSIFKNTFSDNEKELVRKKYNLPEKFLLNVGTLEERKNALNIVKATKNNRYPLILIGKKTDYYKQIDKCIADNNMTNIHCLSNISQQDLAIIYQLATIFIYPSVIEGFGIPIIEALFSKTPVITNKEGVFPEAGGPNSSYVDVNDSKEIEIAIADLWDNESKRIEMSEIGYIFVQKFNDKDIADAVMQLYKTI
jgi:glycosyltransferase involved in cell wall biosynthesis